VKESEGKVEKEKGNCERKKLKKVKGVAAFLHFLSSSQVKRCEPANQPITEALITEAAQQGNKSSNCNSPEYHSIVSKPFCLHLV
jgi:hypothetical protein